MTHEHPEYEPEIMCDGDGECFSLSEECAAKAEHIRDLEAKLEAAEAEIVRLRRMRFPQVGDGQ